VLPCPDAADVAVSCTDSQSSKKKKKRKPKKKTGGADSAAAAAGSGSGGPVPQQTEPPSVPVKLLFPSGKFPEGEWQSYKDDNLWRETSAEKRELERLTADMVNDVRQAAEVHRQVRRFESLSKAAPQA
jgi:methionyl aminopeptidase